MYRKDFCLNLLTISIVIMISVITICFGASFNYKCDTEKQEQFILKCITINPNNKDQPAIIEKCKKSATIFCDLKITTKQ